MGKIKDLSMLFTELKLDVLKAIDTREKAADYARRNYKPESEVYKTALEKLNAAFREESEKAVSPVREAITEAFQAAREDVAAVVAALPTEAERAKLDILKFEAATLSPDEKRILAETVAGTYMGRKQVAPILGAEFVPVDSINRKLAEGEKQVVQALEYIISAPDGYAVNLIARGDYLGELEGLLYSFLSQYGKAGNYSEYVPSADKPGAEAMREYFNS